MTDEQSGTKSRLDVPFPPEAPRHLRVSIGPGKLTLRPGAAEPWVTGTFSDIEGAFAPRIETDRGDATISHRGSGTFRIRGGITPNLDLSLGTAHPYDLTIEGGANDILCDLGGLPLTAFSGQFGAGRIRINASAPNPVALSRLQISTGATDLTVSNIANFNASELLIEGGAAAFHLDFGGQLRRDCSARISTGVASVTITLPRDLAARVKANTTLGSLSIGDGFMTRAGAYWTEPALTTDGPVLTLEANSSLGSLKVRIEE